MKVGDFDIDLSPIHRNEVLMNPQRYTYQACAITVRASAMLRLADYPCLLTSEPVTATLMTNIIARHKEIPAALPGSVRIAHQQRSWISGTATASGKRQSE